MAEQRVCFGKPVCLYATTLRKGVLQFSMPIASIITSYSLPFFPDGDVAVVLPLEEIGDGMVHVVFRPLVLHPFYLQPPPPSILSLPAHFRSFFSSNEGVHRGDVLMI